MAAIKQALTWAMDLTEPWVPDRNMTDQFGKVALVTGGNSGLGLEFCKQLAKHQAHVIMACRDANKARRAIEDIRAEVPWAQIDLMQLDLASFKSITAFVDAFKARRLPLHMLFNNAGEFFAPPNVTEDGYDATLQVTVGVSI